MFMERHEAACQVHMPDTRSWLPGGACDGMGSPSGIIHCHRMPGGYAGAMLGLRAPDRARGPPAGPLDSRAGPAALDPQGMWVASEVVVAHARCLRSRCVLGTRI